MEHAGDKKGFVRRKFAAISPRYDLLNSLLSFHCDRYWRWVTSRELRDFPEGTVLDCCAGTLPLSLELARQAFDRLVVAVDFCEEMLRQGWHTLATNYRRRQIKPVCGDGEEIPLRSASVWGVTVAFGVRNLARVEQGLAEMLRVLRPGGKLLILEFSRPHTPVIKDVYNFYLNRILPRIAGWISGDPEAYEYLASSIAGFYEPEELLAMLRDAGFVQCRAQPLTFGVVTLYVGVKP